MTDFCTVSQIEAFLQLTVPAGKLASAQRAIREATVAIKNYCGQVIEQVDHDTLVLDVVERCTRIYLPELPVLSVDEVLEDTDLLVETDDYKLGQHGVLYRMGGYTWLCGVQAVTVEYSHGYATIPEDIQVVATRAAARAYQAGLRADEVEGVPGITSKTLGAFSVAFGGEGAQEGVLGASAAPLLLKSERMVLDRYRPNQGP